MISKGADVLDIGGSWEVFSETMLTAKGKPWHETDGMNMDDMLMPFITYTVSDSLDPVRAGNGLMIVLDRLRRLLFMWGVSSRCSTLQNQNGAHVTPTIV